MVIFCQLTPIKMPKSKFWKMKNFAGDTIILPMCTKNHNHLMYSSWDMEWDRENFLSFWTIFCSLPPKNLKNWNFEKMKKNPGDIIFHKCTKNQNHMLYFSWDMACGGCNYYFSFWAIFCPFTPLTAQKIKIWKKW